MCLDKTGRRAGYYSGLEELIMMTAVTWHLRLFRVSGNTKWKQHSTARDGTVLTDWKNTRTDSSITGDHSKWDQIVLVKKGKYIPGIFLCLLSVLFTTYGPP